MIPILWTGGCSLRFKKKASNKGRGLLLWAWAELDEWSKLSILPFQEPELTGNRKSQLAIEYGYRVREKSNTWVFWVHAGSAV